MVAIGTLSDLPQLRNSGYGQPEPRHGLQLLFWFANDCINIVNGSMVPKVTMAECGFHPFHNKVEDNHYRLLPMQNHPYYEVGNLNALGAENLPMSVRRSNTHYHDDRNKDRIIVSLNDQTIDRVYVTEHSDMTHFSPSHTYEISLNVIRTIRTMELDQFLSFMKTKPTQTINIQNQTNTQQQAKESWFSWCTIL